MSLGKSGVMSMRGLQAEADEADEADEASGPAGSAALSSSPPHAPPRRGRLEPSTSVQSGSSLAPESIESWTEPPLASSLDSSLQDSQSDGSKNHSAGSHSLTERIRNFRRKKRKSKSPSAREDATQTPHPEAKLRPTSLPPLELAAEASEELPTPIKIIPPECHGPTPTGSRKGSQDGGEKEEGKDAELSDFLLSFASFNHRSALLAFLVALSAARVLPDFFLGLLWGLYVAVFGIGYLLGVFKGGRLVKVSEAQESFATDTVQGLKAEELAEEDDVVYRGWMNELAADDYAPASHHINATRSVLVRLHGSVLRLATPRHNVLRHAAHKDPSLDHRSPNLVSQRLYDISGAHVSLRPEQLAKRRWWSRKYPICISLQRLPTSSISSFTLGNSDESEQERTSDEDSDTEGGDRLGAPLSPSEPHRKISKSVSDTDMMEPKRKGSGKKRRRTVIWLFARTCREKEHWFQRLRQAACHQAYRRLASADPTFDPGHSGLTGSMPSSASLPALLTRPSMDLMAQEWSIYASLTRQFATYMESYVAWAGRRGGGGEELMDLGNMKLDGTWQGSSRDLLPPSALPPIQGPGAGPDSAAKDSGFHVAWANAIAARIFYDFSRDDNWINAVVNKIERKLAAVHLPYFIEGLHLARLNPGRVAPKITGVHPPRRNEWGLWLQLDVEYPGGLQLVLETKVNLMKLKQQTAEEVAEGQKAGDSLSLSSRGGGGRYADEDEMESPESSPDEDSPLVNSLPSLKRQKKRRPSDSSQPSTPKEKGGKKLLNFLDKVVHTDTFQAVTDNKHVRKVMQGISETRLELMVEVEWVAGLLALNIPPPPSNRLWYAFRQPPQLKLKAQPKVGTKLVELEKVEEWIAHRLELLLHKNLLLPNMDDISIPLMSGAPLLSPFNA